MRILNAHAPPVVETLVDCTAQIGARVVCKGVVYVYMADGWAEEAKPKPVPQDKLP